MARQQKTVWVPTVVNVVLSLASIPIAYFFNKGAKRFRPEVMLIHAMAILAATTFVVRRAIPAQPKIFYGFSLFAFTSVVDLLIPLEIDGFVTNFMDVYLKNGEPYLFSAWGAIAAYWDGTFNLICYLIMGHYVANGLTFRNLALFYSSNILNSMVVLLLGAFLSHTGLHWCTILNIPYVLLPAYVLWKALAEHQIKNNSVSLRRPLRQLACLLLVAAAVFNCMRGIASLGSRVAVMSYYRETVEPIINQKIPAPFAAVQGIVCLLYFAPAYMIMAVALHTNHIRSWVKDLAIIMSGAALQAEVSLLGMAAHPLTQEKHRLAAGAAEGGALALHWAAHVLTLGAPLLAAALLVHQPDDRLKDTPNEKPKDKPNVKPKGQANVKPKGKFSDKPKDKSSDKPKNKPKDKPEDKLSDKKKRKDD